MRPVSPSRAAAHPHLGEPAIPIGKSEERHTHGGLETPACAGCWGGHLEDTERMKDPVAKPWARCIKAAKRPGQFLELIVEIPHMLSAVQPQSCRKRPGRAHVSVSTSSGMRRVWRRYRRHHRPRVPTQDSAELSLQSLLVPCHRMREARTMSKYRAGNEERHASRREKKGTPRGMRREPVVSVNRMHCGAPYLLDLRP
jgi:hypothetical protein